jgi:hypothetical protein
MGNEEREFNIKLAPDAWIVVRMQPDPEKMLDWAAVLVVKSDGALRVVGVWDNAHGYPERHRFRHGVKLAGEPIPSRGAARLDLPRTIAEIKAGWEGMVERWQW